MPDSSSKCAVSQSGQLDQQEDSYMVQTNNMVETDQCRETAWLPRRGEDHDWTEECFPRVNFLIVRTLQDHAHWEHSLMWSSPHPIEFDINFAHFIHVETEAGEINLPNTRLLIKSRASMEISGQSLCNIIHILWLLNFLSAPSCQLGAIWFTTCCATSLGQITQHLDMW